MTEDTSNTGHEQVAFDLSKNKVVHNFPCYEALVLGNFVGLFASRWGVQNWNFQPACELCPTT